MKIGILTRLYKSTPAKAYVKWANEFAKEKGVITDRTNHDNAQEIFPIILMAWLSLIQCGFIAKNKEMPKEKKATLVASEVYSVALGVVGGLLLRKPLRRLTKKFTDRAEELYKATKTTKEINELTNGIKTAVPAAVSIVLFQYLGQVIATPFASKTSSHLNKQGKLDFLDSKKNKQNEPKKALTLSA